MLLRKPQGSGAYPHRSGRVVQKQFLMKISSLAILATAGSELQQWSIHTVWCV